LRIERFRTERRAESVRRAATVIWEDSSRPDFELFFEADVSREADVSDSGNAFLLAAAVAASLHGERRLRIAMPICPRLAGGIRTALAILRAWHGPDRSDPGIEAIAESPGAARRVRGAALWLTAGIDSLYTLHENRRIFPPDHPLSFRTAIYVPHLNFPGGEEIARALDLARRQIAAVRSVAAQADLDLVVVGSNQRHLEPDVAFPGREALGALLAATAHFLASGVGSGTIAASFNAAELMPYGSHPLLDPLYSSADLPIRHHGWGPTRLEKIRAIADWPLIRHVFVCFEGPLAGPAANCGRCEKCLRTMTGFIAAGARGGLSAFPFDDVTPSMIRAAPSGYWPLLFMHSWAPLQAPLRDAGRRDLAEAVRLRVKEAARDGTRAEGRDWRGLARNLDRRFFRGAGIRLHESLRRRTAGRVS